MSDGNVPENSNLAHLESGDDELRANIAELLRTDVGPRKIISAFSSVITAPSDEVDGL